MHAFCILRRCAISWCIWQSGLFRAKWTERIHQEWIAGLLEVRPDLTREQLERTRDLMDAHALDCIVEDCEDLIPALSLPGENDRHVLAAAIKSRTDVIVTFNLRHFPQETLASFGIESQHPDEFVTRLIDLAPHLVCEAAKKQRMALKRPSKSVAEFLAALERQQLAQTVAALRLLSALL